MKQKNVYCRDFAKCEGELAKGKLHMISLDRTDGFTSDPKQLIIPKAKDLDFQFNKKLEEKFKNGFDEPIPLYVTNYDKDEDAAICLEKVDNSEKYLLHLPIMIQSKEEIQIAYHYLDKFFKCSFKCSRFDEFIFNPKLIELLFGEAKKFSVQNCHISVVNYTADHLFKFVLTNLTADKLRFSYTPMFDNVAEKYKDDLFKILSNGNDKFGKVDLSFFCHPKFTLNFYNEFVDYVATSKDLSKVVSFITFDFFTHSTLALHKKAAKVCMKQEDGKTFTAYQIDNIHDPSVRYLFCNVEDFNSMFSKLVEHFDFGKNHVRVLITKAGVEV